MLLPTLIVLVVGSILSYLISLGILLTHLKHRHFKTWESLGKPNLFLHGTLHDKLQILRFLSRKEYQQLDDPVIAQDCRRVSICFAMALPIVLAWMLFVLSKVMAG